MRRRDVLLLAAIAPAWPALAQAKPKRIAFLGAGSAQNDAPWLVAFHGGMRELGWTLGSEYVLDTRFADSVLTELPRLAAELVAVRPDLVLTPSDSTLAPLLDKTRTIPIVVVLASDPVRLGFAKSLQRPGGNVTGLTSRARELAAKRVQLLKEAFPGVVHIAILHEPGYASGMSQVKEIEEAAARLNLKTTPLPLTSVADIESLSQRASAAGSDAYIGTTGPLQTNYRSALVRQVAQASKPAIFTAPAHAAAGGLMSYGVSPEDNFRRAAAYVDKIFKGAKPADLPIEEAAKFELVVNLRTAKALRLVMPPSILVRADRVID
jgi:putative tryptophan/tyrosine transport system substrate-binding protein